MSSACVDLCDMEQEDLDLLFPLMDDIKLEDDVSTKVKQEDVPAVDMATDKELPGGGGAQTVPGPAPAAHDADAGPHGEMPR